MSKKLFTKVVSLSLTAAMVLSMAPVNASAAKAVKPKSMKAPKASKIKVGQTKTITASRKSKKSTNDVKYVNFKPAKTKNIGIGVKTSDDTIVSVEKVSNGKYTYTGVNTGTATLTITSRAKTAKGKKLQAKLDVTVINPFKVTQTGAYTFTMSTADKLEKVDKRDVKVTQEGNTVDNAVKSVKLSEDKMSVEVTMEIPFVDQQKYNVEFGKEKDSFVASVGAPDSIRIDTQAAVINKPTEIKYAVLDAKGMDVTKVQDASKITVDVVTKSGYYDVKGNKLTMWKVGETAEATVTYHTWTYDQKTGKENIIEAKATINCVDKSAVTVTGLDKWTIADRILSWDTDEMKTMMAEGTKSKIWVRMKKSDGTTVDNKSNPTDFSFDKINTATLYVYAEGDVYATRQGMEYAKVTYFDGLVKYQYTLPITVGAKSKPTTLVLGKPWVVISKDKANNFLTRNTIKVLDQYAEPMENMLGVPELVRKLSGNDVVDSLTDLGRSKDGKIQIFGIKATDTIGTGIYELKLADLKVSMTVNAVTVTTDNYRLEAETDTVDLDTINEGSETSYLNNLAAGIRLNFIKVGSGINSGNGNADFINGDDTPKFDEISINGEKLETAKKVDLSNSYLIAQDKTAGANRGSLLFYAVAKDPNGTYVLHTPKAGNYTIRVVKKDGDKTYVMTDTITVKGKVEMPEINKHYTISKVPAENKTVSEVAKIMIGKDGKYGEVNQTPYVMMIEKGTNGRNKLYAGDSITVENWKKNTYYLDTAALPLLVTEGKDKVWVVMERLDIKAENGAGTTSTITPSITNSLYTVTPKTSNVTTLTFNLSELNKLNKGTNKVLVRRAGNNDDPKVGEKINAGSFDTVPTATVDLTPVAQGDDLLVVQVDKDEKVLQKFPGKAVVKANVTGITVFGDTPTFVEGETAGEKTVRIKIAAAGGLDAFDEAYYENADFYTVADTNNNYQIKSYKVHGVLAKEVYVDVTYALKGTAGNTDSLKITFMGQQSPNLVKVLKKISVNAGATATAKYDVVDTAQNVVGFAFDGLTAANIDLDSFDINIKAEQGTYTGLELLTDNNWTLEGANFGALKVKSKVQGTDQGTNNLTLKLHVTMTAKADIAPDNVNTHVKLSKGDKLTFVITYTVTNA